MYSFVSMHFFEDLYPAASFPSCLQCKKVSIPKLWTLFKPWRYLFAKSFNCGSQMKSEVSSWICALLPPLYTFMKISLSKIDDSFPCERFLDKIWWNIPTEVVEIFRCTYNGEKTCPEFSNLQNLLRLDCPKWDEALTDIRSWCDVIAPPYLPFPPLSVFLRFCCRICTSPFPNVLRAFERFQGLKPDRKNVCLTKPTGLIIKLLNCFSLINDFPMIIPHWTSWKSVGQSIWRQRWSPIIYLSTAFRERKRQKDKKAKKTKKNKPKRQKK